MAEFAPFEKRTIALEAICDLPGKREERAIEQKVSLQVPWSRNEITIPLHFMPALIAPPCNRIGAKVYLHSCSREKSTIVVSAARCSRQNVCCAAVLSLLHRNVQWYSESFAHKTPAARQAAVP